MLNHDTCPVDETSFRVTGEGVDIDLTKHNIIAWVYGHIHFDHVRDCNGVLNICTACPDSGGVDSTAAGIRKISVTDGKVTIC